MDFYGFYTGQIFDAHAYLGAHPGPGGTTFRVFAPAAKGGGAAAWRWTGAGRTPDAAHL